MNRPGPVAAILGFIAFVAMVIIAGVCFAGLLNAVYSGAQP